MCIYSSTYQKVESISHPLNPGRPSDFFDQHNAQMIQCSYLSLWASLAAQLVKNPPAMRETWVQSLGWEDLLEEVMATHSGILTWRIPMDRGAW